MRKPKKIVGHIETLDRDGVTGWATGPASSPRIELLVAGQPRDVIVERQQRLDVAQNYGPAAKDAGFYISLRGIAPSDSAALDEFLASVEVRADGVPLRSTAGASRARRTITTLNIVGRQIGRVFGKRQDKAHADADFEQYVERPTRLAQQHGRELQAAHDATAKIRPNDILVFVTARNEMARIPYFLDFYRKMGVAHFLFVDNDSSDGLIDYLKLQPDCSVWHTKASYKASNFGVHWMNYLLGQFGVGHWCLTLDPDEFLVFPYCEDRNLHELVQFLDSEQRDHLFCILLDMYSDHRVSETIYSAGQNPLDVACFFDGVGYVQRENASFGETYVQGGPRRRIFFRENPSKAPAINKTPLVKWGPNHNYLSSTHMLSPRSANPPHPHDHLAPSGCLLHFKFLSLMAEKAKEEIERKEHYDDSIEYKNYHSVISQSRDMLFFEKSVRFKNSRQLCSLGFMTTGQWF